MTNKKRTKDNTLFIYWEGRKAYIRLVLMTDSRFRHGISLATYVEAEEFEVENFTAKDPKDRDEKMKRAEEQIEIFRENVWQYLKEAFNLGE